MAAGAIDAPREVRSGDWLAENYKVEAGGFWRWKGARAAQPEVAMREPARQAFWHEG
jgi:hypothetical protein